MNRQSLILLAVGLVLASGAVAGVIAANNLQTPWPFVYLTLPLSFFAAVALMASLIFALIRPPR
jgi:hypothetical protein